MSLTALIIEADSLELELMATVLARDGFSVERAADGAAGIEKFGDLTLVDLVVCAYALPHKSGAEVCAAVKKARPETRFVLLHPSGNDVDICAVILSRVGCDAVLPTPFRYDALKSLLGEWGMRPAKTGATTMPLSSFAVPAPDISMVEMPTAPEPPAAPEPPVVEDAPVDVAVDAPVEALAPEPPPAEEPMATEEAAESPIPIPVVFPEIPAPVLAEFTAEPPPEVPQTMPALAEYAGPVAVEEGGAFEESAASVESAASAESAASVESAASDESAPLVDAPPPDVSTLADEAPPPPPLMADEAAHSSGSAEWTMGPPPPPAIDDEPTLNMRQPDPAEPVSTEADLPPPPGGILDDEPTVIPGELPPPDVLAARADETFDFGGTTTPELPAADAPPSPSEWLSAPPGTGVTDGFDAVDFGSLDSVLDAALGDTPTARVDDESIDPSAAGFVRRAAPSDASPFAGAPEPVLPPFEAQASEPEPVLPPFEAQPSEPEPVLPPFEAQTSEPEPVLPPFEAQASEPEPVLPPFEAQASEPEPVLPPFEAQASEPEQPPVEAGASGTDLPWAFGPPPEPEETPAHVESQAAEELDAPPLPFEVPIAARDEAPAPPPVEVAASAPPAPPPELPPPPPVEITRTSRPSVSTSGERSWAPSAAADATPPAAKIEARGLVQPSPVVAGSSPVFASAPPPAPAGSRTWRPAPSAAPPASRNVVTLGAPIERDVSAEANSRPVSPTPPQTPVLPSPPQTAQAPVLPTAPQAPPPMPAAPPPLPVAAAAPPPPPPPREAFSEPPPPPIGASTQPRAKAEPRTALPPGLAPAGDLATTPLPRLLFELYGTSFCGALKLHRKGADRTIDIWNGIPVAMHVVPEPVGDDLASLLTEHGRITQEQHEDAERRAPGREAQLLVALGVIDERDLLDVIREQTELRLAATFAWRDGTYAITASKNAPDSIVLSEVHPIKVIWRGVSEHYDVASLLQFFSTLRARYMVATPVFPIHYETLGPFLRRAGIAALLDGHTTFEQALRSDDSQALLIAQCLYVLIVTEMVRAQSTPGAPAVFPDAVVKTKQAQPVDYRDLSRACEDIARTYLAMKEQDYFAMLELQRSATDRDVVAAHERLVQPFLIENLLPGLPEDVVRRAREIEEMLNRAHDTLISAEERRRYMTRLATSPGPSAGANI